ncbi:hypothetical protein Shyhy02_29850 [Streptomyces hygroscopicus subsp. hygroscopicus]|nr:hypothetical protein Shyhy02_29850 [Streptomyces hygroscopicus subsp. hygroscopicus]
MADSPFCELCPRTENGTESPAAVSVCYPLSRTELIARGIRPDYPGYRKSMCLDCYRAWKAQRD